MASKLTVRIKLNKEEPGEVSCRALLAGNQFSSFSYSEISPQ